MLLCKFFSQWHSDSMGISMQCVQVCWLNLDYLHLAQAALQCSAAFTALLYIEYWCKEHYGRLTLGEEDLLSEVCSSTAFRSTVLTHPSSHVPDIPVDV